MDAPTLDDVRWLVDQCRYGRTALVVSGSPDDGTARRQDRPGGADPRQAVLFLKPELLAPEVDLETVWKIITGRLRDEQMEIGARSALGAAALRHVIAAHYGVINRISRLGAAALSASGRDALWQRLAGADPAISGVDEGRVLGGHQLLDRTGIGVGELQRLVREAGSTKLAPGSYLSVIDHGGERYAVLNGFHPAQLAQYTAPGAVVVALEILWSGGSWDRLRRELLGATDPARAVPESLRGMLLAQRAELGIDEISMNRNGVHGSAGPVEAMVEVSRFFSVPVSATLLGARLGIDPADADAAALALAADPPVGSAGQTLFEVTEGVEPDEALPVARSVLAARR
jgi:hypothetical protein